MNQSQLIQIGMGFIFIGILIIFIGSFFMGMKEKGSAKYSVVGLFGFIPFGFGNDKRLVYFSLILMAVWVFLYFLFFYRIR